MDGKQMLTYLRQLLEEDSDSGFVDDLLSYQLINEAALDFVNRTKCLRTSQDITTVADQANYDLNPDFAEFYIKDRIRRFVVKYNDGNANTMLPQKDYEEVFIAQSSSGVAGMFSVINKATLLDQNTGTATSTDAASGGESDLTDTAGDFTDVEPGDYVHNTTDGSDGVVLSKTSTTVLKTALFGGTNDYWTSSDAYVIQPQGRMQLVLEPPPESASHTVTVPYIQRPNPVYSDYGVFRMLSQYIHIIVKYAAWLYKYRDREPNYGDKWYVLYDQHAKLYSSQMRNTFKEQRIKINLRARRHY